MSLAPKEALTALDIMERLRLRCDLVTLSACESGLSQERHGDELVGFMRAFMVAGAPTLVSTLWPVDQRSTRILMERFYQEVQTGVGFAKALKQAQLYLRSLTRLEAMDILARFLADEMLESVTSPFESQPGRSAEEVTLQQASAYLKRATPQGDGDEVEMTVDGEERIFAEPYYWAPFILVGGHG
jgi:CHAT domain-containing protein